MISLNGKDYIPKEYLEIEERPGNTNSVDDISDYLKNVVMENRFQRRSNHRLNPENNSEQINESQESLPENAEEGKSLIEDFNMRVPHLEHQLSQHNNSIDSRVQEERVEQINESRNRIFLPPIQSEGSLQSKSSEFNNPNSRNMNVNTIEFFVHFILASSLWNEGNLAHLIFSRNFLN